MNNTENRWIGIQLFYCEPYEDLLRNAVEPFFQKVLKDSLSKEYFFIRYDFRGPHLRLFFKGNLHKMESALKPFAVESFESYFRSNPSIREENDYINGLPEQFKWLPNNSIHFMEYTPENERYGGQNGVRISEKEFRISSGIVLKTIKEDLNWNYDTALSTGICLQLGLLYAAGLTFPEMIIFFKASFDLWYKKISILTEQDQHNKMLRKEIIELFEKKFKAQKQDLIGYVSGFSELIRNKNFSSDIFLEEWIKKHKIIFDSLRKNISKNLINTGKWFIPWQNHNITYEQQLLWSIISSYIHMTNNRLGVLNRDESYLAFLIRRSIESI